MTKSHSAITRLPWPVDNVLAVQTSRYPNSGLTDNTQLVSNVNYAHFNLALHVGDIEHNVINNRQQLLQTLPATQHIQWLNQVHGSEVATIEQFSPEAITADASITRCKNLAMAIMTADCLPILLSNVQGTEIAAIHGGWRCLAANIIAKTLSAMHSNNDQLIAWLGPCIGTAHFEVGAEVRSAFVNISPELSHYFCKNKVDRFQADLAGIAVFLLQQSGIVQINRSDECTVSQANKYFSFRRENKTGRMASVIVLQ